jgi:hypothetical protein
MSVEFSCFSSATASQHCRPNCAVDLSATAFVTAPATGRQHCPVTMTFVLLLLTSPAAASATVADLDRADDDDDDRKLKTRVRRHTHRWSDQEEVPAAHRSQATFMII